MSKLTLTHPVEDVHHAGDPLGRSYTQDLCALAICYRLAGLVTPTSMVELCLGGGAFVRAAREVWPGLITVGVDVGQREVDSFIVGDSARGYTRGRLQGLYTPATFGLAPTNPPWGKAVPPEVTLGILRTARKVAVAALLLPLDILTQAGFEHDVAEALEVWPLLPRPWAHDRGVCVLVHVQGREDEQTVFRPLRWKARC